MRLIRLAVCCVVAVVATSISVAYAQEVKFQFSGAKKGRILSIALDDSKVKEHRIDENSLYVRADKEVKLDVSEAIKKSAGWVSDVRQGYDSLLVVFSQGVTVELLSSDVSSLRFKMAKKKSALVGSSSSRFRLKLAKVRLLVSKGSYKEAEEILNVLAKKRPKSVEVRLQQAELDYASGRWKRSLNALRDLSKFEKKHPYIKELREEIEQKQSSYISTAHDVRFIGDNVTNRRTSVEASYKMLDGVVYASQWKYDEIDAQEAIDPRTGNKKIVHKRQQTGKFYRKDSYDNGNELKTALFIGDQILGVGAAYQFWGIEGITDLSVAYQEPFSDFTESLVFRGTRDQVRVGHKHRLNHDVTFEVGGAINRYGLNKKDSVAVTSKFNGTVSYAVPHIDKKLSFFSKKDYVSLNYQLDSEYAHDRDVLLDSSGVAFNPLAVSSREVHTLGLFMRNEIRQNWYAENFAGYALDRLGGNGVSLNGSILYEHTKSKKVQLSASRSVSSENTDGTNKQIGLYVKWHF